LRCTSSAEFNLERQKDSKLPRRTSQSGSELFIVDNSEEEWKVLRYLHDWCQLSKAMDIATGYFEIGSLLALRDEWKKVDSFRILMGDEVSKRTKAAFVSGLSQIQSRLDSSLELEKEKNDFLIGVPAIVEAMRTGKISCRVYRKDKFHAKAYLTHARQEVIGSFGLVGSSNFTYPGITENIELNVQISGTPVAVLQEWYEQHWNDAEDVTPEILKTIERHTREHTPFDVYAKSLQEFFRGHELTAGEWERDQSKMYPVLDHYQKEGYQALMKIASRYDGAFLCDGVGLGKTFVGLMLIERLIMHEGKNVALIIPKAANDTVWRPAIKKFLPHIGRAAFSNLKLLNHTDLQRGGDFPEIIEDIASRADAIIIDEAHHFRNPGPMGFDVKIEDGGKLKGERDVRPSRYRKLYDLIAGPKGVKQVFMLTATPVNNRLLDLQHMIELFSRKEPNRFSDIGIHSLPGHFRKMEKQLEKELQAKGKGDEQIETNLVEAEEILQKDSLFQHLVVQRSRAYVRESQLKQGANVALFPVREDPQVAEYSVKKTYGKLLDLIDTAFNKTQPLFSLAIYYPLAYPAKPDEQLDPIVQNRQKQVVGLIKTQFLKRFESSAHAFERSCERLLEKLLAWAMKHSETSGEKSRLEKWKIRNAELIGYVHDHQLRFWKEVDDEEAEEDIVTEEMLDAVELLDREQFDVPEILNETLQDLDQIAVFLNELKQFQPKHDDKLKALIKLLKTDSVLKNHKVLIFSEFAETARYLKQQLIEAGIAGVEQIDSGSKKDRAEIIRRFSPYYNNSSTEELTAEGIEEIRVLISTDVLSEGLNLQDATRLINYDLHWNPVRLMQRIGRVDRRMNPAVEKQLVAEHPDQKVLRGKVAFWNFLPPDDLNKLLTLYTRVSHKTLRISKTFGIEGRKLLTPQDEYDALKDFNREYEGETTPLETMHLELQQLFKDDPQLPARLDVLPGRVFSGKRHVTPNARAVFFCFRIPRPDHSAVRESGDPPWTEAAGETRWLLYDLDRDKIIEEPTEIINLIRCAPETPRVCAIEQYTLADIRGKIEKHLKNTRLKQLQAPVGVKPILKAWMELN
jgi:superfamily II DNA or RNA helicase/HKD family nuclease